MKLPSAPHPRLPENLQPLNDLARDLRWSWRPSLRALFAALDPDLWEKTGGNPVALLADVAAERLQSASADAPFVARLEAIRSEMGIEDDAQPAHPATRAMKQRGDLIAYFSAEFGLTELLPIYAGGLGVLAGDHLKSASDLRLPLVGVGLFYKHGYFRQSIAPGKGQTESSLAVDPDRLPISVAALPDGGTPMLTVKVGERDVQVLIRIVQVGRIPLLLLDTDVNENHDEDRAITAALYGGDHEMRIRQEIVLGIGGLRALDLLRLRPTVRHINEGHAAFVGLEKIRQLVVDEELTFAEARERAAAGNVFTTHTPVPAGIDRFSPDLVARYLAEYVPATGLSVEEFLRLGQESTGNPGEPFSMAVFALRLCGHANAVSQLHARVSRRLWLGLLPELADEDVKIRAITNGVHRPTWTAPEIASLSLVESPERVDRAELWSAHESLRSRLVDSCRTRLRASAASPEESAASEKILDPKALTIGFARRFATYKRANLILRDPDRLARILSAAPVQILFAGKAHPHDEPGKDLIRSIAGFSEDPRFRGKIVLLPDYDMRLARTLVAGCDVWLNNPVRPHEASGTSGMKAAMNGVLNMSVLDGWWDEAPYEETGFVIGPATDYAPDEEVATSLYEVLENQAIPLFFRRDEAGLPQGWIEKMIQSASRIGRQFSSDRMVLQYLEQSYVPAAERRISILEGRPPDPYALAPFSDARG
ncbi:MAG: alpha-glucan family phosphorylase [Acidobacteriota bacterium]|nr:alpha-glucan family phosphorylase [Acidobacteriota bacterium]